MGKRLYFSAEEQLRLKVFLEQIEDFLFFQKASFLSFQLARTRVHEMALNLSSISNIRNSITDFVSVTAEYPPSCGIEEIKKLIDGIRGQCRMDDLFFRVKNS